jgi:serine/threonine protein kinase
MDGASRPSTMRDDSRAVAIGDRYRIVNDAGSGGMGLVAEAIDTLLERRVAIKFLHRAEGPEARANLIREARAMAGLRHRSICRVLEIAIDPPAGVAADRWRPFLVLEWVAGTRLDAAWKSLEPRKRLPLLVQVVEAVAALHAAGLVHRDLKPANILVDGEGVPVLVDFGLSARTGDGDAIGGTPGWSAPEQFEPGTATGPPADVFALGVLMYVMLTGAPPFGGTSTGDVLRRAREGDAPLPESLVPDLAPALQRITLAAIDPDPAARYADAAALLADLRRFRDGETVLARPRRIFNRFADELERHLADTEDWRRQGLATADEIRPIREAIRSLQRPESPWILDSRRLSLSQVSMYLGGWLLVLALTVGVWNSTADWRERGESLPWMIPATVAATVTGLGFLLAFIGEQRAALGFLFTSTILAPAAVWQWLRTTGTLAAAEGSGELLPSAELGLGNDRQLAIAGCGLALAMLYRLRTPSNAFTVVATAFVLWTWFALGLRTFDLETEPRAVFGQVARWLLPAGAALAAAGFWLDRRAERPTVDLFATARPRDGSPFLVAGLVTIVAALATLSTFVPEWFRLGPLDRDESGEILGRPEVTTRAAAFLVSGVLLFGLSLALGVRATPLADRCARALRWIVPSFVIIPIAWLEIEDAAPGWGFWLATLGIVSVGLVALSSTLQWRPFLLSGLLGLLDATVRGFIRIDRHLDDPALARIALMVGVAVAGIATMVIATYPERPFESLRAVFRRGRSVSG